MSDALREAAGQWHNQCYQLKRTTGFYERGVYIRAETDLTWQSGNVQPASQAAIERLPEGSRKDGAITIFTHADLRTAASPNDVADRIVYQGVEYEVGGEEKWPSHSRYTCTKVGQ